MVNATILILDDDDSIRESLSAYFEDEGFRTVEAESAEEAVALLKMTTADAAIVDLRLPGMNGEAFIRHTYERCPEMVYLIYTGSPEYKLADDVAQLPGVSRTVFLKPVEKIDVLVQEIRRLLSKKRTVD